MTLNSMGSVMKLIETTISGKSVRMRYADDPNPEKATQWFEFQVLVEAIGNSSGGPNQPIPEFGLEYLAQLHRGAILRARDTLDDELQRLLRPSPATAQDRRTFAPIV